MRKVVSPRPVCELACCLGRNIRRQRRARRLSQERLSEKAGIHYTYLGHIERGNRLPSLCILHVIASALSVPTNALLKNVGAPGGEHCRRGASLER